MNRKLKNALVGCAVAAAVLVMAGIASCAGFYVWLNRPGKLLQPDALMAPDTTGFVAWTVRAEDKGTRHLLDSLIEDVQRQSSAHSPFPPWMQGLMRQAQNQGRARQIGVLLPLVAAWEIRPSDDPESDLSTMTLSLPHLGNRLVILDAVLGFMLRKNPGFSVESHGGVTLYTTHDSTGRSATFWMRGSSLFLASDLDTARRTVDRLAAGPDGGAGETADSALARLYARTPAGRALRGAIVNTHGQIPRALQRLAGDGPEEKEIEQRWSAMEGLAISGGFEGENTFTLTLEARGPDEPWARSSAETIGRDCQGLLERAHIHATLSATQDERWAVIEARIDDPASQIEALIDFSRLERGKRREPETR